MHRIAGMTNHIHTLNIIVIQSKKVFTRFIAGHRFANKAMVFPVVKYGCESWIIKKAECQRTDALELWCWRRLGESLGQQ